METLISINKNAKSYLIDNIAFQQIFSRVDCTIQTSKILKIVEEVFFGHIVCTLYMSYCVLIQTLFYPVFLPMNVKWIHIILSDLFLI